jgi:replication initiation protein RepC
MMTETGFPTLPQGHKRFSVEQLLIEVAPELGIRPGALQALLHMMKRTKPDHWTSPDREPVFFAAQDETAAALGKSRRSLFNIEKRLEELGLIEKRVKGNGQRSAIGDCGIVFSRLIALVPDLLRLAEHLKTERKEHKALRNRRSTYVRYIKQRLSEDAESAQGAIGAVLEAFQAWPRADALSRLSNEQLEAHVNDAQALCATLDEICDLHHDSSGKPAQNFPCFIQENNQETHLVNCNVPIHKRSAGKPAQDNQISPPPIGSGDCLEKDDEAAAVARNTQFLSRLKPDHLFRLASKDMQAMISQCAGGSSDLREFHFLDAAERMCANLGINHSAWVQAVQTMGQASAMIAVLLLDANRDHPTAPVQNVGGALRAMTRRFRGGGLNLVGSLIGLSRRRGL